jgi:16S rRNA (guanine1207-N2)-methyltransferase
LLNSFNKNVEITYSDVNPKCVELTSNNLRQYDLNGKCLLSDGYLNIDERYDFILFNPPIRAGKEVIYRLYNESLEHLNEGGKLYLVIRKDKGALSHMKYLESIGAPSRIINKDKGYLVIECL